MALSTSITLTVSDYDIKLSRGLKFYKNDALKLIFTINYWGIDNANGIPQRVLMPLEALSAILFMETPEGTDSVEAGAVEGNVVTFYLDSEYTQNVGVSRMQIRLFDDDGCAITLPEFPFEIKENIYGGTDVNFSNVVLMDSDGTAIVTEDLSQIDVGDVFLYGVEPVEPENLKEISDLPLKENLELTDSLILQDDEGTKQAPLGTIVDEIKQNSQEKIREIESELNAQLSSKLDKNGIVTMANMGQDVKEAMTGGSVAVVGRNSVLTENIVSNQVTPRKTSFIDITTSNLMHLPDGYFEYGSYLTFSVSDEVITINGTLPSNSGQIRVKLSNGYEVTNNNQPEWTNEMVDFMQIGKTYCVNQYVLGGTLTYHTHDSGDVVISVRDSSRTSIASPSKNPTTLKTNASYLQLYIPPDVTFKNYKLTFAIEEAEVGSSYKNLYKYKLNENITVDIPELEVLDEKVQNNVESVLKFDSVIKSLESYGITIQSAKIPNILNNIPDFHYVGDTFSININDNIVTVNGELKTYTYIKLTNNPAVGQGTNGGDKRQIWTKEMCNEIKVGNTYSMNQYVLQGSALSNNSSVVSKIIASARTSDYTNVLSPSKGLVEIAESVSYIQLYFPPGIYNELKMGVILQQDVLSTEYTPNGYYNTDISMDVNNENNIKDYPTQIKAERFKIIEGRNFNAIQGGCSDGEYIYYGIVQNKNDNDPCVLGKIDIKTGEIVKSVANFSLGHCNSMTYCEYDGYIHCVSLDEVSTIHRITTNLEYVDSYEVGIRNVYPAFTGFGAIDYNSDKEIFIFLIRGDKKGYAIYTKNLTFVKIIWTEYIPSHAYGGVCSDKNYIYQAIYGNGITAIVGIFDFKGKLVNTIQVPDFPDEIEEVMMVKNRLFCTAAQLNYTDHTIWELKPYNFTLA